MEAWDTIKGAFSKLGGVVFPEGAPKFATSGNQTSYPTIDRRPRDLNLRDRDDQRTFSGNVLGDTEQRIRDYASELKNKIQGIEYDRFSSDIMGKEANKLNDLKNEYYEKLKQSGQDLVQSDAAQSIKRELYDKPREALRDPHFKDVGRDIYESAKPVLQGAAGGVIAATTYAQDKYEELPREYKPKFPYEELTDWRKKQQEAYTTGVEFTEPEPQSLTFEEWRDTKGWEQHKETGVKTGRAEGQTQRDLIGGGADVQSQMEFSREEGGVDLTSEDEIQEQVTAKVNLLDDKIKMNADSIVAETGELTQDDIDELKEMREVGVQEILDQSEKEFKEEYKEKYPGFMESERGEISKELYEKHLQKNLREEFPEGMFEADKAKYKDIAYMYGPQTTTQLAGFGIVGAGVAWGGSSLLAGAGAVTTAAATQPFWGPLAIGASTTVSTFMAGTLAVKAFGIPRLEGEWGHGRLVVGQPQKLSKVGGRFGWRKASPGKRLYLKKGIVWDEGKSPGTRVVWAGVGLAGLYGYGTGVSKGIGAAFKWSTGKGIYKETGKAWYSTRTAKPKQFKVLKGYGTRQKFSFKDLGTKKFQKAWGSLTSSEKKGIIRELRSQLSRGGDKKTFESFRGLFGKKGKVVYGRIFKDWEGKRIKDVKEIVEGAMNKVWPRYTSTQLAKMSSADIARIKKAGYDIDTTKKLLPKYREEQFLIKKQDFKIGEIRQTEKLKVFGKTILKRDKVLYDVLGQAKGKIQYNKLGGGKFLIKGKGAGTGMEINYIGKVKGMPKIPTQRYEFIGKGAGKGKKFVGIIDIMRTTKKGKYFLSGGKQVFTIGENVKTVTPSQIGELRLRGARGKDIGKLVSYAKAKQGSLYWDIKLKKNVLIKKPGVFKILKGLKVQKPTTVYVEDKILGNGPKISIMEKINVKDAYLKGIGKRGLKQQFLWGSSSQTQKIMNKRMISELPLMDYTSSKSDLLPTSKLLSESFKSLARPELSFIKAETIPVIASNKMFLIPAIETETRMRTDNFGLELDTVSRTKLEVISRTIPKIKSKSASRTDQRIIEETIIPPKPIIIPKPITRTRTVTTPKSPTKLFFIPTFPTFGKPTVGYGRPKPKPKLKPLFQTYVRRRRKWIPFGELATRGVALKSGAKYVTSTLGASFKIVKTKKRTKVKDIKFIVPKKIFRKPKGKGKEKAGEFTFIQRGGKEPTFVRGGRLAARGERREIQFFRKKPWGTPKAIKILGG